LLDRLGDGPRKHVLAQLKSVDPAMRALAVRILRRHGDKYGDDMLSLGDDSSDEVKREVLLAIRRLKGPAAMTALTQLAATYNGSDRYQLDAIHIAAEGRKLELLDRLEANGPLSAAQFPLVQVLAPDRAAALVLARLKDASLEDAEA